MKFLQKHLVYVSSFAAIATFAFVCFLTINNINRLLTRYLDINYKRSDDAYRELSSAAQLAQERGHDLYKDSIRKKAEILIAKDSLAILPSFNDAAYTRVREFLAKSLDLDPDLEALNFFVVRGDIIKSWTILSRQNPLGFHSFIPFNTEKMAWEFRPRLGKDLFIPDRRVIEIVNAGISGSAAFDYEVIAPDGTKRSTRALDIYAPLLPFGYTDYQQARAAGAAIGFLRYTINLEGFSEAQDGEESLLVQAANQQRAEGDATSTKIQATGREAKLLSFGSLILAAAILLALGFYLAARSSNDIFRPILILSEKVRAIQEGHYDNRITVHSRNEIGRLEAALEAMRTEVKRTIETLQKDLADKTGTSEAIALKTITAENQIERFVYVLCHDLSLQISEIILTAEMVCLKVPDNATMPQWVKVSKAANHVMEIIDNMRKIDAARSGKLQISLQSVSLKQILENSRSLFAEKIAKKELNLVTTFPHKLDDFFVLAEPGSLGHDVINNIISNAIKFSDRGKSIAVITDMAGDNVKITIADQGIGMPEDILLKLFDHDPATVRRGTDNERGTGFGLPIAKSFIDLFGGHISVDSITMDEDTKEHGTSVTIELRSA